MEYVQRVIRLFKRALHIERRLTVDELVQLSKRSLVTVDWHPNITYLTQLRKRKRSVLMWTT